MSKKLLSIEYEYDFTLLCISCHEKDYRLCWYINKALQIELIKIENLEIYFSKEKLKGLFSLFSYEDKENQSAIYLISNRSSHGILIPEQKQSDYFMIIKGTLVKDDKIYLIRELKKIPIILTIFETDPNKLKSRKNLIF
jgi:hypothetical protein